MTIYNPGPGFAPGTNRPNHYAADYAAIAGTPISSAASGTVHYVGTGSGYGNTIIIYHGTDAANNHIYTVYAHMQSESPLQPGDTVVYGQEVGQVGSTNSTDGISNNGVNHLHFEVFQIPDKSHEKGTKPAAGEGTSTGLGGIPDAFQHADPKIFDGYPSGTQLPPGDPYNPPDVPIGSGDLWDREGWNDLFEDAQEVSP